MKNKGKKEKVKKAETADVQKKKILVIDDDESIQKLMATFLESLGYDYELKGDGVSARKWLDNNIPDLILLDIMLPDIQGIEFARWINSLENLKHIPIIHVAAFLVDDVSRKASLLSGARYLIAKPIDFNLLEKKIKEFIK
ncbi:MAG: response regulator [Endomicrobiales bacterium]|nr:response regulator [Endomicrobiales bacterium]